jgi:O-antigen/teichoic acid export membrane protein
MQFVAPYIAAFYNQPTLTNPIRVLSLMLILAGINSVQQAYVSRKMIFKKFFFATIIGTIISAFVGIALAYKGYGIWALVAQQLTNQCIDTLVLWFTVKWRPQLCFSLNRIKTLFSFGWKLLVSSLVDTIYNNLYTFVIGKVYSPDNVGYYNRGKNIPNLVITNINSSIQSVLFPAISKEQSDKARVKVLVRRSIMTSTFLIFPCMAGLAAVSRPLTIILLTEKWLPCVPFMQFCCFVYAFWPIHTANLQAISALGRSDIYLKLEIQKKILGVAILIITIPMGIYAMMVGRCICTVISSFLNARPNKKLFGYSFKEQIMDIMPAFCLSIVMALIVASINFLNWNVWITLLLQILVGVLFYMGVSKLLHLESLEFVLATIKQFLKKRKE